ncbi:hypothetical protein Tco_0236248 [Tanacetum coccineum]
MSDSDSECDLPFCDNFVTFSNLCFNDNDAFTSSDDESLSEEDVPKENFKIYSNPLFEFNDEYISSDANPLFNKMLEDIESEDSYVSKLDEPDLLVTPLSKLNEDECFDSGIDDADFNPEEDILLFEKLLNDDPSSPLPSKELNFEELKVIQSDVSKDFEDDYYDSEGDIIYLESLLNNDTTNNLPPEVFLDHDPRSLKDEPDKDDLKSIVKVFDPEIHEKMFSPTYVRLPFEDRHYLSLTYVFRIFLPYFTYLVDSSLPLSSVSEDIIFNYGIAAYSFYSLESVAYESPMMIFIFFYFCPKDKGIREPAVSTGSPSSTTIDQDASSTSTSQTNQETPCLVIPLGVKEADWNGYLRKGRKTKPKRQNRTRNGKAWKRQSQVKAQV